MQKGAWTPVSQKLPSREPIAKRQVRLHQSREAAPNILDLGSWQDKGIALDARWYLQTMHTSNASQQICAIRNGAALTMRLREE